MKNYVPLVLAVLLAVAATLGVRRVIQQNRKAVEETCTVVVSVRDIKAGEVLSDEAMTQKKIPLSARPVQAAAWSMRARLLGQKASRPIASGDYLLLTDVEAGGSFVGEGEWAIALHVDDAVIAGMIQPGDEVAVIATLGLRQRVPTADLSAPAAEVAKTATMVLFPRVRVLNTGGRGPGGEGGGSDLIVGLKPQEAQVLIAAQQKFKLTLALRRPGDETAINRLDIGMVDDETFNKLVNGVQTVTLSATPGAAAAPAEKK